MKIIKWHGKKIPRSVIDKLQTPVIELRNVTVFFLRVCISHLENLRLDLLSETYFDGSNLSHPQQFGTFGHPSPEKRKRDVTRGEGVRYFVTLRDRGGGSKIAKFCVTLFLNGPKYPFANFFEYRTTVRVTRRIYIHVVGVGGGGRGRGGGR